jgi:hypothetical protein
VIIPPNCPRSNRPLSAVPRREALPTSGLQCGVWPLVDPSAQIGNALPVNIFAMSSPRLGAMSRYDRPSHRVYMTFIPSHGSWFCQFLEADVKAPLPRKLNFADPEKIRELAKRGETWGDLESKQALETGSRRARRGLAEADAGTVCEAEALTPPGSWPLTSPESAQRPPQASC